MRNEAHRRLAATVTRLDRQSTQRAAIGLSRPPVGALLLPAGLINISTVAPTSGRLTFLPYDIGRKMTVSHLGYRIGTNASGGTTEFTAGIYPDNGDGSAPDTRRQLAVTDTADPLSSGTNREVALAAPVTLSPGRYWVGALYRALAAPSTNPTLHSVNEIHFGWLDSGILWFNGAVNPRCLYANSQLDLPTGPLALTAGRTEQPPVLALKRSA